MIEPLAEPNLADAIMAAMDARLWRVRVALPGRVDAFDPTTQKADVQPLIMEEYPDEQGNRQVELLPTAVDVPVVYPGSGAFGTTFPLTVGDTGLLVFCSSSIDAWLVNGGQVDPGDNRRHTLSDAVFYPGLRDFGHVIANFDPNNLVINTPTQILLGGSTASDPVVRVSDLTALISSLSSVVSTATVTTGPGGCAGLGTAIGTTTIPAGSAKVLAE